MQKKLCQLQEESLSEKHRYFLSSFPIHYWSGDSLSVPETLVQTPEVQQVEQVFETVYHTCVDYLYHSHSSF